jgi:MHS family proline/betaine transporter-like MFS transporter
LIAAFGVFAAGFFMRPLGSILFGYIGDKKGRKLALTISVGMMAVPTFLIGVLPTYQQIGLWASLSLVLLRLLQGLSVGGEFTTSAIFLIEGSAARRRGFLGSFAPLGASAGTLLGSAIGAAVTTLLGQSAIESWGWRVPFLIGILVGVVGLYIRSGLAENRLAQPKTKSPVREALRTEWPTILRLIGLNAAFAVSFYMGFVYVTTYIRQVDHIAQSTALDINTVAMLVSLVLIPLIGALSDRIGRKPILLAATGGLFVLACRCSGCWTIRKSRWCCRLRSGSRCWWRVLEAPFRRRWWSWCRTAFAAPCYRWATTPEWLFSVDTVEKVGISPSIADFVK